MKSSYHAFTLVELIVTMSVILLLTFISIPAFAKIGRSFAIDSGARHIVDELNMARQMAQTHNCPVEVRLYKLPDVNQSSTSTPTVYRALQLFLVQNDSTNALGKVSYLNKPTVIAPASKVSSLMDDSVATLQEQSSSGQPRLPNVALNYKYRAFQFKPDGGTTLPIDGTWFLSLYAQNDPLTRDNDLPQNFVTIQIDPQTGRTRLFRP